jgi:hypothetical protein
MERVVKQYMSTTRAQSKRRIRIRHLKNKAVSLLLMACGIGTAALTYSFEGKADITVLIFFGMFAIPLFFARKNYVDF